MSHHFGIPFVSGVCEIHHEDTKTRRKRKESAAGNPSPFLLFIETRKGLRFALLSFFVSSCLRGETSSLTTASPGAP